MTHLKILDLDAAGQPGKVVTEYNAVALGPEMRSILFYSAVQARGAELTGMLQLSRMSTQRGMAMDSRRSILKKILVGTAAAAVPAASQAAVRAVSGGELEENGGVDTFALSDGPAPWWLLAPVGMGTALHFGWYVHNLGPVERGASVLTLRHTSGRVASLHICAHRGRPQGVASTALVDLVLMDGGSGSYRTDEKLGRVILGLAERIRQNEVNPQGDLNPLTRMMTHNERTEVFGADTL